MSIITLTTDMGVKDHYVASIKGAILSNSPNVQIIDVSHQVKPFNVSEAAFYISSCYKDFPKGTVHIIGIDTEPIVNFSGTDGCFPSILEFENHYFIANDNGFFGAFLQENKFDKLWRIDDVLSNPKFFKFPTKNMLVPIASKIINGEEISSFATPVDHFKNAFYQNAIVEKNLIKGNVIHIDSYGNLITNVSKELFELNGKDIPFTIYFRRKDYYIDTISTTYNEVSQGERVAIFNENNLLEIAINRGANGSGGGAEKLFGMHVGDIVRIEFSPRGSKETIESLF